MATGNPVSSNSVTSNFAIGTPVSGNPASGNPASGPVGPDAEADMEGLLAQLQADRAWLLRQIDSGRWSSWRLDLAALERELGQLLEQLERQQS